MCLELASYELDVDMDILKTAALLHDIARTKEDEHGHTSARFINARYVLWVHNFRFFGGSVIQPTKTTMACRGKGQPGQNCILDSAYRMGRGRERGYR